MSQDLKKIHVKKNANIYIQKRFLDRLLNRNHFLKEHKDTTEILTQHQKPFKTFREFLKINAISYFL